MADTQKHCCKITKIIHDGKYSRVFKCTEKFTNKDYAGKKREKFDNAKKWREELHVIGKINFCDNLVGYAPFYHENATHFYVFMELCDCNLEQYIKNRMITPHTHEDVGKVLSRKYFNTSILELLHQTVYGLKHLHDYDILHRNIRPSSILLVRTNNKTLAKLADFKFIKKLTLDVFTADVKSTGELSNTQNIDEPKSKENVWKKSSDMFSYGVLCYYALTKGTHPFGKTSSEIKTRIKSKKLPNFDKLRTESSLTYSSESRVTLVHMIKQLLLHKAENRLTAKQVVAHPAFYNPEKKINFLQNVFQLLDQEPDSSIEIFDEGLLDDDKTGETFFFLIQKENLPDCISTKQLTSRLPVNCFDHKKSHLTLYDWIKTLYTLHDCAANGRMPEEFCKDFCKENSRIPDPEKFLSFFASNAHPQILVHLYEHCKEKTELKNFYSDFTNELKEVQNTNFEDRTKIEDEDTTDSGEYLDAVMGFKGFARVCANPYLECQDNQQTRSCFVI